jgi:hypothetical protein
MNKRPHPLDRFARDLSPETLTWKGLRTERRGDVRSVESARAIATRGLDGDHRMEKTAGSARQITLISEEFIQQIAYFTGRDDIDPALIQGPVSRA